MTRTFTRVALGLAVTLGAVGVYAAPHDQNTDQTPRPFMGRGGRAGGPGRLGGPGGGPMALMPMLPRQLNLTDAQREQIRNLAQSHRDEWKALAERARPAREALQEAITADGVDEGLIRARSAEWATVEADLNVARARAHAEVFKILTDDQKAQLKDLRARFGHGRPPA